MSVNPRIPSIAATKSEINTPRGVANQDNDILWSWESKPFGEDVPR